MEITPYRFSRGQRRPEDFVPPTPAPWTPESPALLLVYLDGYAAALEKESEALEAAGDAPKAWKFACVVTHLRGPFRRRALRKSGTRQGRRRLAKELLERHLPGYRFATLLHGSRLYHLLEEWVYPGPDPDGAS